MQPVMTVVAELKKNNDIMFTLFAICLATLLLCP